MLAAGLHMGAAREAGLYMIKAGGAILDETGNVVEEEVYADALPLALRHIVEKLHDGTLVKGKTVVVIDTRECAPASSREPKAPAAPAEGTSALTHQGAQSGRRRAWKTGPRTSPKSSPC